MENNQINTDILIIGGGSAGVAAAVASARMGVRAMLIEKGPFLGGKATRAIVSTICGAYFRSEGAALRHAHVGFPKEFCGRLSVASGTEPFTYVEGLRFLPYDHQAFKLLCDAYMLNEKVQLFLHASLSSVGMENGIIDSVDAIALDRRVKIFPKTVIDCTGEALVATLCDLEVLKDETYQASAMVFSLTGIESADFENLSLSVRRSMKRGVEAGRLHPELEKLSIIPGSLKNGSAFFKLSVSRAISDELNKATELELFAREAVSAVHTFLKAENGPLQNAEMSVVASELGIRTGRRSLGKYILSESDVLNCVKFDQAIANGVWPIEYWGHDGNVNMDYFNADDCYEIPADCLMSADLGNLYFAGRNISASDRAIASARVIGTCLATGYAAGKMAAGSVLKRDANEIIQEIKSELLNV